MNLQQRLDIRDKRIFLIHTLTLLGSLAACQYTVLTQRLQHKLCIL